MQKPDPPLLPLLWLAAMIPIAAQTPQAAAPPAADNRQKAVAVLQRAQRAAGGLDRLQAIRDMTRRLDMLEAATGSRASETVEVILPGTIRLTQKIGTVEITAFFDGISGWIKSPWGSDDLLPSWQRDAAQQELIRQLEILLLSDQDSRKTIEYVKAGTVEDKAVDILDISSPSGGKLRLAVDAASGDVITLEYPRIGPRGQVATVTDYYSDYRKLPGGLRAPFKVHTLSDGQPYMDTVVSDLQYNQGLQPNVLGRKDPLSIE